MLAVGTGLCLNNSIAVFEAVRGKKSAFVRTPKSGSIEGEKKSGRYLLKADMLPVFTEIALGLYCLGTLIFYLNSGKYFFGFFIGAYAVGLLGFGLASLKYTFVKAVKLEGIRVDE
jgi:hypothetical protein